MKDIQKQSDRYDLGIATTDRHIYIYSHLVGKNKGILRAGVSIDGLQFRQSSLHPSITLSDGTTEDTTHARSFSVTKIKHIYYLTYQKYINTEYQLSIARSYDALQWKKIATLPHIHTPALISPTQTREGLYGMYSGEGYISLSLTKNFTDWDITPTPVLFPRKTHFDRFPLQTGCIFAIEQGNLFLYIVKQPKRENDHFAIGAALLDKNDLLRVLWRSESAVWEQPATWKNKQAYPIGASHFNGQLLFYFGITGEGVIAVSFESFAKLFGSQTFSIRPLLQKHIQNPIITPVLRHAWESQATFNAAAIYDEGKVHLLYRAQGDANTSVLGYAISNDGFTIDHRANMPIYLPRESFETPNRFPFALTRRYMSGGGYGGCEDPRLTRIEDHYYLTYVGFNGIDPPRVAFSSISVEDFRKQQWNWKKAKLISPPGVVDKNAVLFPETIKGKYVMMHRIFPNMLIDFLDNLDFDQYLKGEYMIQPKENSWDSRKVGAGAPPIKTKDGWLLIYHAVDDRDASQYKIGAMLLDLRDPTKVLYRSNQPILYPTEWYENEGYKRGVAYPCGAVVVRGTLLVYYGGADTVVCVAAKKLDDFLYELKESNNARLDMIPHYQPILSLYD